MARTTAASKAQQTTNDDDGTSSNGDNNGGTTASASAAATSARSSISGRIEIPAPKFDQLHLSLTGLSPLIVHRWSEKARKAMLDKQMKTANAGREAKNPEMDFYSSLYWLDGMPEKPTLEDLQTARFGFPSVGFKSSAVDACSVVAGVTKVAARAAFQILGEYVVIDGIPSVREDMVRIAMGTADIRYRGEFKEWGAILPIRYNPNVLSAEQIVNLFNTAGFAIGVGEWRPAKDGSFGMFEITR